MQSTTVNVYVCCLQQPADATLTHNILTDRQPTGSQRTQGGPVGSLPLYRLGFKLNSSEKGPIFTKAP